jgi:hypothetical protein
MSREGGRLRESALLKKEVNKNLVIYHKLPDLQEKEFVFLLIRQ